MSWGYIPKKVREARRQKRARKKFKSFSCLTCNGAHTYCYYRHRYAPWTSSGPGIITNCKFWTSSPEARCSKKDVEETNMTEKKQNRKGIFSRLFK